MRKKWNTALVALAGFALLGAYVIGRQIIASGFDSEPIGYWIGTAIGAGIPGAVIGGLVSFFRNRSIEKAQTKS